MRTVTLLVEGANGCVACPVKGTLRTVTVACASSSTGFHWVSRGTVGSTRGVAVGTGSQRDSIIGLAWGDGIYPQIFTNELNQKVDIGDIFEIKPEIGATVPWVLFTFEVAG